MDLQTELSTAHSVGTAILLALGKLPDFVTAVEALFPSDVQSQMEMVKRIVVGMLDAEEKIVAETRVIWPFIEPVVGMALVALTKNPEAASILAAVTMPAVITAAT